MPLPGHSINRQVSNSRELQALESVEEKRSRKEWQFPPAVLGVLPVTRVFIGCEETNRLCVLLKSDRKTMHSESYSLCVPMAVRGERGPPCLCFYHPFASSLHLDSVPGRLFPIL